MTSLNIDIRHLLVLSLSGNQSTGNADNQSDYRICQNALWEGIVADSYMNISVKVNVIILHDSVPNWCDVDGEM